MVCMQPNEGSVRARERERHTQSQKEYAHVCCGETLGAVSAKAGKLKYVYTENTSELHHHPSERHGSPQLNQL